MKIGFFASSCLPVHALSLEERPLGGTETGLIRLAEALQNRGHEVLVFTAHSNPPKSVPRYFPHLLAPRFQPFDALVLVKDWKPAFYNLKCNKLLYWTGDGFEQYITFGLGDRRVMRKLDRVLGVSTWHIESMSERSGAPREKFSVLGNGVHIPYFVGHENRVRHRLIYTAAPYRGLGLLPPVYEALRKKYSDLELHVFSGLNIYDTDKPFSGPHVRQYEELARRLRKIPGVLLYGNILQSKLARELMKSSIFVYPNTVMETCCITALEALAAGCPVVASAISALPETVGECGALIDGEPRSESYLQKFTEAVDRLLEDDAYWRECSEKGRAKIRAQHTWEIMAERFEQELAR